MNTFDTSAAAMSALLKLRQRARAAVKYGLKTGKLVLPDHCPECGRRVAVEAHHENYAAPLAVDWQCQRCHARRSKEIRGAAIQLIDDNRHALKLLSFRNGVAV